MDSIGPTPSSPVLQSIIDALRWGKQKLKTAPIMGEKGSWLRENAPDMLIPEGGLDILQDAAQGLMPFEMPPEGTGSRIPRIRQNVGHTRGVGDIIDAAGLLPVGTAAKLAKPAALAAALYKGLPTQKVEHGTVGAFKLPGGNILLPDAARSTDPESPVGAWRTKQLTNYLRRKFGTGDDPVSVMYERSPDFQDVLTDIDEKYSPQGLEDFIAIAHPSNVHGNTRRQLLAKHQELTPREFNAWDRFAGDNTKVQPRSEWGSYYSLALPKDMQDLPDDATIYSLQGSELGRLLGNTAFNLRQALNAMSPDAKGTAAALRRSGLQISEKDLSQMSAVDALQHYGYSQKAINHYSNPNAPINQGADIKVGKPFEDGSQWRQYNYADNPELAIAGARTEGKFMSNCLETHCADYLESGAVFSLRDKTGKPTISVAADSGESNIDILEVKGFANKLIKLEDIPKVKALMQKTKALKIGADRAVEVFGKDVDDIMLELLDAGIVE